MHNIKIVHRDIKPQNIFIQGKIYKEKIAKLGDFGLAEKLPNRGYFLDYCGTTYFMAPEIQKCLPYNQTIDIYAFGKTGQYIFDKFNIEYPKWTKECCTYNPIDRPNIDNINIICNQYIFNSELSYLCEQKNKKNIISYSNTYKEPYKEPYKELQLTKNIKNQSKTLLNGLIHYCPNKPDKSLLITENDLLEYISFVYLINSIFISCRVICYIIVMKMAFFNI